MTPIPVVEVEKIEVEPKPQDIRLLEGILEELGGCPDFRSEKEKYNNINLSSEEVKVVNYFQKRLNPKMAYEGKELADMVVNALGNKEIYSPPLEGCPAMLYLEIPDKYYRFGLKKIERDEKIFYVLKEDFSFSQR